MKHFLFVVLLFLSFFTVNAQNDDKRDYTWVLGYWNAPTTYSLNKMNFRDSKLVISPVMKRNPYIGFLEFNTSISDEKGDLLFYNNGCQLRNKNHNLPIGCDSINFKPDSPCFDRGLRNIQGGVVLPLPEKQDTFMFFHKAVDINGGGDYVFDVQATRLYAKDTMVKVIYKNKKVVNDTVSLCEMTAARHANGKDWWIVNPERGSNRYRMLLLTKDGMQPSWEQSIGESAHEYEDWWSQATFSPDGKHYVRARGAATGDIHFFDFDRVTGKLSNPRNVNINPTKYRYARPGVAFSSNNRFMYVSRDSFILQYDLLEADFLHSADTVANWQPFEDGNGWVTTFQVMQTAPDCRIYIATGATTSYMHAILYPNRKGKACGVLQNKLKFPTKIAWGVPNFPYFRLGADGAPYSPCDSTIAFPLPIIADDDVAFSTLKTAIYPNPVAQGTVNIDFFDMPDFKTGHWQLFNITGQQVAQFDLLQGHQEYNFDLGDLVKGLYFYSVKLDGGLAQSGKLIIE
jgi:hypothetical protein